MSLEQPRGDGPIVAVWTAYHVEAVDMSIVLELSTYEAPVVTGGTRTQLHAPDLRVSPSPACHDWGEWGEVREAATFDGWRDWCACSVCQDYREELEK